MAVTTAAILKTYFETGDFPTQSQFVDLIDTLAALPVGGITGSGTANEITYWTAATTIGSLTTATYPSLTELSYVKGLTSAVQTQLNNRFTQGGNSFGVAARLGTNDAFALEFETNNTLYGQITSGGLWGIGTVSPIAGTRATITGSGTTSATYGLQVHNSTGTNNGFLVRDDGLVSIGSAPATDFALTVSSALTYLAKFTQTAADHARIWINAPTGKDTRLFFTENNTDAGSFYIGKLTSPSVLAINGGVASFNSSGWIGVGSVTNQTYPIDIQPSSNVPSVNVREQSAGVTARATMGFGGNVGGTTGWIMGQGSGVVSASTRDFYLYDINTSSYRLYVSILGNIGIGTTAFGTNAATVLAIANGTVPSTSPADMIQIFSADISAGNASLGLRTETAVVTEAVVSDRTLSVTINGTIYKICLKV